MEIEVLKYKDIKKVNQSSLKKILSSPGAYKAAINKYEQSTESHFVFGSLVDDKLLAPKTVDDKYYKMSAIKISDALVAITKDIYAFARIEAAEGEVVPNGLDDNFYTNSILDICLAHDYQSKWGNEAKLKNIRKNCAEYFTAIFKSNGKIIIPEEQWNKATICVAALNADKYTSRYLKTLKDTSTYTHVVLEFEIKGIECKSELDKIFINHTCKTIQPIDYKTTGKPISGFEYDFWKYRYDFQAAFYREGLLQDEKIKKLIEDGYTLLNFRYIVVDSDCRSNPMIFVVIKEVNSIGLYGGTLSNGRKLEGIYDALRRYQYHTDNNKWDYPKEYYEQEGSLAIEV